MKLESIQAIRILICAVLLGSVFAGAIAKNNHPNLSIFFWIVTGLSFIGWVLWDFCMWRCPKCDQALDGGVSNYCGQCGTKLGWDTDELEELDDDN